MSNEIFTEKSARILDLLQQVDNLNKMIALHKDESKNGLMVQQYQDIKNRFLEELKEILGDFEIDVSINTQAA